MPVDIGEREDETRVAGDAKDPFSPTRLALLGGVATYCIAAFDPGLGGGVSFLFPGAPGRVTSEDLPIADGNLDAATLAARIRQMAPNVAIVERAASRPGQGVASVFKFGCGYGTIIGVLAALGLPTHLVAPSKWKRHFGLDSDKKKSRALALRLWPDRGDLFARKRDHGRAESALIGRYAAERILQPNEPEFAGADARDVPSAADAARRF